MSVPSAALHGPPSLPPCPFAGRSRIHVLLTWCAWWLAGAASLLAASAASPAPPAPPPDAEAAFAKFGTSDAPAAARTVAAVDRAARVALEARLDAAAQAWLRGDLAAARLEFRALVSAPDIPPHLRSYAHLRLAQSLVAGSDLPGARAEYARIAGDPSYPAVHRHEAAELQTALDRSARGLPARDPAAHRSPVPPLPAFALELFVAPHGDDASPGTRERPFATLERARDTLRARRAAAGLPGPVAVRLLPGEYPRTGTFVLGPADSGTADAPIVYLSDPPGAAVLYGGTRLRGAVPVTDATILARLPAESRGHVYALDLRARGLAPLPPLQERGYGKPVPPATLEVFFDGQPLHLARWPNTGFVDGGAVSEPGSVSAGTPSVFAYLDPRPARWTAAPDAWLYGYFANGWADRTLRIVHIDPARQEIACGPYALLGRAMQPQKWFNQGRIRYYAFNLLEELDAPGEWYLDRATDTLYFYPPADPTSSTLELGVLDRPMVSLQRVSHVRFEGLVFDLGRANGLDWRDCTACLLVGCTVRRFAAEGVGVRGGRACILYGCDLTSLGRNATTVTGGDRATLSPGGHLVENCRMWAFGRLDRTYVPGVQLEGVGHRVAHNLFAECPSSAIRIEGNDHLIEYNRVHRAVLESEDQGGMELFGNATYRGVVFRYNHFSDIGGSLAMQGPAGRAAIRFDDAISGLLVYGNVFHRAAQGFGAININGGRDHVIENNLFAECTRGITGGYNPRNTWWQKVDTTPGFMRTPLYLERYPELRRIHDEPGLSQASRNVFWRCGPLFTTYGKPSPEKFDRLANLDLGAADPGFAAAARGDFRLAPDSSLVARIGFRPIPVDEIGLYADPHRASWPAPLPVASGSARAPRTP